MRKRLSILGLIVLLLAVSGCPAGKPVERKAVPNPAHKNIFVTGEELARCLSRQEPEGAVEIKGAARGGVVPHHLLAGRLTARFMEALALQHPGVVIVAGPNHRNLGARVITGFYDWETPEGIVRTDSRVVKTLLEKGAAVRDEGTLSGEHSVGSVIPFIGHYLPEARVVPLILHRDVSLKEIDFLLAAVQPYLDEGAVLVASVDFSHYLTRQAAEYKDEITLKAMRDFDYNKLYSMGNDHLDSPACLALVLRDAEKRGNRQFQILDHTNSGILLKNDLIPTTSYFTLLFSEDKKTSSKRSSSEFLINHKIKLILSGK
ncbi:MAG: AmmeMemoRadiSam system protein B [Peptococcaceae bacterium]|jgi:AmmeMemoRadiSam system protein B|nr:AmmeMemoRadiSam system protein B [Peptococcaceae bacterium]MDH7524640.1 AmmeMemoRadiSam system protein B [Peptococcaceae bacterium]